MRRKRRLYVSSYTTSSIIANSLVGLFQHARHEHRERESQLDDIMPISLSAAPTTPPSPN
jgi:hypothetical protein